MSLQWVIVRDGGCPCSLLASRSLSIVLSLYVVAPNAAGLLMCCQRPKFRGVLLSLVYKALMSVCGGLLSLHRGFYQYDTDCPPCPVRCRPLSPYDNQSVSLFVSGHKKGGQSVLSPVTVPLNNHLPCCSRFHLRMALLTIFLLASPGGRPNFFTTVP